jgi:MinD-like ATPase involved in chromosome partitioning or flagellar assembly
MTDFEWPPDEIAGPAEETRPPDAKPATARASVSVPGSTTPPGGPIPQPLSAAHTSDGFRAPVPAMGRASLPDLGRSTLADAFRASPRDGSPRDADSSQEMTQGDSTARDALSGDLSPRGAASREPASPDTPSSDSLSASPRGTDFTATSGDAASRGWAFATGNADDASGDPGVSQGAGPSSSDKSEMPESGWPPDTDLRPGKGLPLPPPREMPAIPLTATAPIPVIPHTPPIPVVPHAPAPPPPPPTPSITPPSAPEAPGLWRTAPPTRSGPVPSTPPRQPTVIPPAGEVYLPTAEEFARRRAQRPPDPVAHMGFQAALRKSTFGLLSLPPGSREQELRRQTDLVRRNFGGLRQITVVNPKGGAGKTVAVLLLAMTFGRKRGGYVLAWDNNETQGTLGMRSQQDFHSRTVRDLLRDLHQFHGVNSRVGDLSQYVRAQGDGMFEVLASDESATAGEMLTADAFAEIREVVSRFYKLIMVDTGNNVRAENWQAAIDATDQLVVTMSARNDSAETAARMLDHLEQSGRQRLVRQAVSIVSLPPSRKELDVPAIERHFAARTRSVLIAPYERMLDSGEPIEYARLSDESQDAWLAIAAAVAEGL